MLNENKILIGGIPSNTSRLFDLNDNKFRDIRVDNLLYIQTTNDAYLTIDADCYTNTEAITI